MKTVSVKLISIMLAIATLLASVALLASCANGNEEPPESSVTEAPVQSSTDIGNETEPPVVISAILEADLSKYSLIRPEICSEAVKDQINVLYQKINAKSPLKEYRDDFYREDAPIYAMGEYEIIVGNTNRPESKDFLSELKYNDFGFKQVGNKIVIAGHSDQAIINAVREFIFSVIQNRDREEGVFYDSKFDFVKKLEYNVKEIFIGETPVTEYRIVYSANNRHSEKIVASKIASAIASASGDVIEIVSDSTENGVSEYEILIGATNRNTDAEISEMSSKLGSTEALIKYDGKKINIFGVTATALLVASGELTADITGKTDKLTLNLDAEKLCKYDDSILSAMSFNVWVSSRTPERNARVVEMVRKYLPDTIGFQEVNSIWLAVLRDGLKDQYAYVGEGRDGGVNGEYNPIFYKKEIFNLLDSGTKWLSDTPDSVSKYSESSLNRIYTYALLERKSDGSKVLIVNTHFDHTSEDARNKQADALVKYLKTQFDYPIVLTGDFNCLSTTSAFSTITSSGMKNSYDLADKKINKDATFTNYGASNKIIDFAFVTPGKIAVSSYRVCSEKINNDYPSDHHPVLIEYALVN